MNTLSAYAEALSFLSHFQDYSRVQDSAYSLERFDLRRMETLLRQFDWPQRSYPIIHVAGTKGKGSICALLASALQAAGYRVGLYTSPYLLDLTEQLQVNRAVISPAELAAGVERLKPVAIGIPGLTAFELVTALAFLHFRNQQVDVAVVEVGLGGRVDATNIIEPLVSVIASISYDHTRLLGNTLKEIAIEKAGIIKPGRPVVIAPQKADVWQTLEAAAHAKRAPLINVAQQYQYTSVSHSLNHQSFSVRPRADCPDAPIHSLESEAKPVWLTIPLLGAHQMENAVTAYAALRVARREGLALSEINIQCGFSQVFWPGRFEILRMRPAVILDAAHNSDSALKLRQTLEDYQLQKPFILIFGAFEDKNHCEMLEALLPGVRELLAVQTQHPRATPAAQLAALAQALGCPARTLPSVDAAMSLASEIYPAHTLVITGSLSVVGEARRRWFQHSEVKETVK